MRDLAIRFLINTAAIFIVALLLPGIDVSGGIITFLILTAILGLVNAIALPLLFILGNPILILIGSFLVFIIDGIVLQIIDLFSNAINIDNILWALLAGFLIGVVVNIIQRLLDRYQVRPRKAKTATSVQDRVDEVKANSVNIQDRIRDSKNSDLR